MQLHEVLEKAIRGKKVIRFSYDSKGGADGPRVGSPHALYAHPTTRNVNCDIHQHRGDSATGNVVPFKPFVVAKMYNVQILDDEEYQLWHLYDGDAPRYVNAIYKIEL